MKTRLAFIPLLLLSCLSPAAQDEVLQIFDGESRRYEPIPWSGIERIGFSADMPGRMSVMTVNGGTVDADASDGVSYVSGVSAVPHLIITTDTYVDEIPNKTEFLTATLTLDGFGVYDDVDEAAVNIRGRGNTSWGFAKKPYRLKFARKLSLCGLPAAKSFVLLANWTDSSLMQNALASKLARMLDLPYSHVMIPVDVTLNGVYRGSYMLTNKPGINAGSVDIDEATSVMWELDTYYDKERKFRSPIYNLPVGLADPPMDDATFERWKQDFIEMEAAAVAGRSADWVDIDQYARYSLVNNLMGLGETGFPKSVKCYKTEGGKYMFGPVWDFDVAMGAVWLKEEYTTDRIDKSVWINALADDFEQLDEFKRVYRMHRDALFARMPEIREFLAGYAADLRQSALRNGVIWTSRYADWEESVEKMTRWLELRVQAMTEHDF